MNLLHLIFIVAGIVTVGWAAARHDELIRKEVGKICTHTGGRWDKVEGETRMEACVYP